ncbi:MAG: hypothetical protein VXV96_04620 [Bdellovibrionota bacterium]|jgi:hypothetical protein|nr:hypothetical protein [Bdellovibrionota bacterium]
MNKILLYTLLILLFLGLSKSFSPSSQKTSFVQTKLDLPSLTTGAPVSIVLTDAFDAGFLIKTYYLKLKIVHGFKQPETLVVRTNKKFYNENKDNVGMSLFRRMERENKESLTPLPPGSIYVGDPAFGAWRYHNSGERRWHFHRVYRHFARQFYWGDYRPNYDFFEKLKIHQKNEQPFYGLNGEFGTKGTLTEGLFKKSPYRDVGVRLNFLENLKRYISIPSWNIEVKEVTDEVKG